MSARPPDGSDQPEAVDQVMLAVLSNPGRDAIVLTPDEERLLDDWVAGHLGPDAAERAAGLAKRNALAAERVLERRLLDAASRVLRYRNRSRHGFSGQLRLREVPHQQLVAFAGRRRWVPIAGAAALASIAAIAIVPALLRTNDNGAPLQVAMVSFADRTPLFESSDIRMRGAGAQQGAAADQRFRDVEMPTRLLRNLVATVASRRVLLHARSKPIFPRPPTMAPGLSASSSTPHSRTESKPTMAAIACRCASTILTILAQPIFASAITDVSGTARHVSADRETMKSRRLPRLIVALAAA